MKELTDIVEAGFSFLVGLGMGAYVRLNSSNKDVNLYARYGTFGAVLGVASILPPTSLPNYIADGVAAIVGSWVGEKVVGRLIKATYNR